MPDEQNPSNSVLFTDLFYAAVIGFAVSKVEAGRDFNYYALSIMTFFFVLEDWYSYYKRVLPHIVDRKKYNLYNTIVEFFILLFWSISFSAATLADQQFFVFFALFMGFRWLAGIRHHFMKRTLWSRAAAAEHFYGISAVLSLVWLHFISSELASFSLAFVMNWIAAAFLILANWTLSSEENK